MNLNSLRNLEHSILGKDVFKYLCEKLNVDGIVTTHGRKMTSSAGLIGSVILVHVT